MPDFPPRLDRGRALTFALFLCAWMLPRAVFAAEEKWIKVTTEHFTVLTASGERVALARAVELEEFRRALQGVIPVPTENLRPVTVVLFKNQRSMNPYLPLEKGKPARLSGFFARAGNLNTIALTVDNDTETMRRVVFHEAVHWQLSAYAGFIPHWLGEGVAELYSTFFLADAKTYRFGQPIEEHVELLRDQRLLPFAQLLEIGPGSLLYNEGSRASIFYAQSWAFLHYLFHGEKSPGRASLGRYLALLRSGRSTADAFREAFGADFATMEETLRDYLRGGSYLQRVFNRTTADIERSLKAVPAAPADLALAKAALLVANSREADAEPLLREAAKLAPEDPRSWEMLGQVALAANDLSTARTYLTHAVNAGSTSYTVYHNLAVTHQPAGPFASFDSQDVDEAARLFRKAIALAPSAIEPYQGLAGLMSVVTTLDVDDLARLQRGAEQAPGNVRIATGLAIGEIRSGQSAAGLERLERAVAQNDSSDPGGMSFARDVLQNERLRIEMEQIELLRQKGKADEALAAVERALARQLSPPQRQHVEKQRSALLIGRKIDDALAAARAGDLATARKLLEEVLPQIDSPSGKMEVQLMLREIARHEERQSKRPPPR